LDGAQDQLEGEVSRLQTEISERIERMKNALPSGQEK
jgi:hypothetical protein